MKVTRAEIVRSTSRVPLPEPWRPAWTEPSGTPQTAFGFSFYKVYTDEGIVGIGPYTGGDPVLVEGVDPHHVGAFWTEHMSGKRSTNAGKGAAGLEIALWDIVGKAAGQPVHRLLGARRDRIMVYAATSRLLPAPALVDVVQQVVASGFRAVKLRLHRPDPRDDLAVVQAVRAAMGDDLLILVDANQNNVSEGYAYWSRQTAERMALALDELGVYFLEEPLPRRDVEGLSAIASAVSTFIAGGEHSPTVYDFAEHIVSGAYDVLQPDPALGGNMGITGVRRVAEMADPFGRLVIPHVLSNAAFPLDMAATLQAMAAVDNCPMVEYPYDPPVLVPETTQHYVVEPILVEEDGCVRVPMGPGLGVQVDEDTLA